MLFISANTVDDTSWKGDRTVWLHDLVLTGSLLQLLYHCLLCSTSSHRLLCFLCNWKWFADDNTDIGLAPLSYISQFFCSLQCVGTKMQLSLTISNSGLSGHSAEVGQAVQAYSNHFLQLCSSENKNLTPFITCLSFSSLSYERGVRQSLQSVF